MAIIRMGMQEPYRSFVLRGVKTVEGRLNRGKFASIETGDFIVLERESVKFEVIGKNIYATFTDMIAAEGVGNVIPDKDSIEDAAAIYRSFYTEEQELEFGVVAIRLRRYVD